MIIEINETNARLLYDARRLIDGLTDDLHRESITYATRNDRHAFVFVRGDNVPIGYVECITEEAMPPGMFSLPYMKELGHISRIGVRKDQWGKGIGRALMRHAEEWLQANGKNGAWLDYRAENLRANAFYNRVGYSSIISIADPRKKESRRKVTVKIWGLKPELVPG